MKKIIQQRIKESIEVKQKTITNLISEIEHATEIIINAYKKGGRLIAFGNGGSAADAQHIVGELINKFYFNRPMLDAIALTTNTSVITAIANDSSYDEIFSKQIENLTTFNDVILGITTSGNSPNIIKAFQKAKENGLITIGFTGETGGKVKEYCDILINIPSKDTPRIQEAHITIGHIICELIESTLFQQPNNNKNNTIQNKTDKEPTIYAGY